MPRLARFLPAALLLAATAQAQTAGPRPGLKPSYSLQAGATFAGRYGAATYFSPTVLLPLTNRFALFGGVAYLRTVPGIATAPLGEAGLRPLSGTNRYLVQGGGQYVLSPRLLLTGSAWKDLTPAGRPGGNPYAGFGGNLGQGVNLRANYRLTEHFSVSGGVRVSSGATAYPGSYYGNPSSWGY